ncbi:hypothetical protein FNF27_07517 [Cafeteria roenbergensis]|uniref:Uncharacterized protein n=1 Tax=Cafeteria roenbergensis TaxID=33653 RepID=A0A5A8DLL9_CAFRO|nr:hypothetical protein FNF27_07517 [Cafeteria roenbergensis]
MPTSDGSTGWTPPYEYDPSSDTPYPIWLTDPEGPTYRFILGLAEQSASLLQAAHEATGLPWWATIVVGTAAARAAFLPLQMYAIRNASRAFDAREDMGRLVAAHRAALQRLGPAASPMERLAATRVLIRGMQAALHDANCYPWRTFAVPFLQIPAAVLAVLGARHLVLLGDESFETGGALWFTDLTVADSTYALPVVCVGLTYAFLEYVFRKPRDGGAVVGGAALLSDTLMRRFKSGLQLWTLMAIPLSSTMPAGLYMGWLTGTLYGFAYVTTIRTDAVHALITGRTASRYRAGGDGGGDDLFDLPGITGGAGGDDAAAQDAAGVAGAGVLSIEPGQLAGRGAAHGRDAAGQDTQSGGGSWFGGAAAPRDSDSAPVIHRGSGGVDPHSGSDDAKAEERAAMAAALASRSGGSGGGGGGGGGGSGAGGGGAAHGGAGSQAAAGGGGSGSGGGAGAGASAAASGDGRGAASASTLAHSAAPRRARRSPVVPDAGRHTVVLEGPLLHTRAASPGAAAHSGATASADRLRMVVVPVDQPKVGASAATHGLLASGYDCSGATTAAPATGATSSSSSSSTASSSSSGVSTGRARSAASAGSRGGSGWAGAADDRPDWSQAFAEEPADVDDGWRSVASSSSAPAPADSAEAGSEAACAAQEGHAGSPSGGAASAGAGGSGTSSGNGSDCGAGSGSGASGSGASGSGRGRGCDGGSEGASGAAAPQAQAGDARMPKSAEARARDEERSAFELLFGTWGAVSAVWAASHAGLSFRPRPVHAGRAAASAAAAARQAREGADADVASRSRLLLEGDPDSRGGLADPERRQQPMSPEDERHMAELKERIDEWLVRDPSAGDFDDFELGHLESADDAVVEHWLDKATRSEWHTHMDKAARADPVRFGSWESRALEHARQSGDSPLRKMPPTAGRIRPRTAAAASATGPASRTARQRRFQLGQQQAASHQQAQAQTRAGRLAATPLVTRPHGDGVSLPLNPAAAAVTGAARAAATVVARGGKVLGGAVRSALSDASGAVSASPTAAAAATPASLGGATSRRGGSGVVDGAATASDRLARQRDAAPRAASKPDAAGSDDGAVGDRDAAADAAAAAALERAKQRLLAGTSGPSARGARSRFALTPGTPRRSDGSVSFPLPSTMEGTLSERRAAASARASAADGSAPGSDPGSSGATSLEEEPAHTVMSVLHEASLRDSGAALPRSSAGGPVLGVSYGSRELRLAAWQRRTRAAARDAAHVAAARSAPARPAPAQHATKAGARVALAQRLKNASSSREAADLAMARLRAVARGETPRTAADIAATLGGSDPSDAPAPRLESAIAGMRDSLIRSAEALKAASAKAVAAGGSSGASDDGAAAGASAGDATGAGAGGSSSGGSSSGGSGSGRGSGWLGSVLNWFGAGTKAAARAESAPAPASPAEAAAGTGSPQAGADSAEPAASQAAEPPKAPRRPAQPTDEELRSASSDCFSAWRGGGRAAASPSGRGSRVIVVDEDSDEHAAGPSPAASAEQDGSRPEVLRSRKAGGAAGDGGGDGDQSGTAAGAGAGERRASLIDGSGRVISSAVSGAIRSEGTHADADHEAWRGGGPAAGAGVPSWDAHHRTEASDRGTASLASAASAAVAGRRRQAAANASAARRPAAKEAGRRAAGAAPADEDWSTANLGDVLRSALADADDPSGTTDAESEDLLSGFDDMDGDGDDAAGRIGAQRSEHRMVKEERSITTAPIDALRLAPGRVGGVGFLPVVPLSRLMAGQGPVRGEQPLAAALRPPNGGTPPTPIPISAQHHLEMSRNGFTHLPEPGQEQDLLAGVREELKAISEQESSQGFEHAGGRVRRLQRELQNLIRDERRRGGGGGGGRGGGGSGASGGGDRR